MERLTYTSLLGNRCSKGACASVQCDAGCDACGIGKLISRLWEYEETGLTAGEILALAAMGGWPTMTTDQCAHKIFKALPPRLASGAICPHCGTQLAVAYHEERLYSVKCAKCETITLVKAKNPNEAAGKCGYQIPALEG